jgi:hypothetical protein
MPGRGRTCSSRGQGLPTASQAGNKRKSDEPSGVVDLEKCTKTKDHVVLTATEAEAEKITLAAWANQGETDKDWTGTAGLMPVTVHLPDKLNLIVPNTVKKLIWEGGFVNIHCFLEKKQEEVSSTEISLTNGGFIKKDMIKRVKNIYEWTTAFTRYISIYLQPTPLKCLEMLKMEGV